MKADRGEDEKDPAQDVVDEFSEKVDAFEEKYKSELNDTETVSPYSFILTNFYSDYAAKITAPDGFTYFGDDTVLSTDEEAYPVTDLFFYDSGVLTSLQYAFNEYDPFELMRDIDYLQKSAEYTDIKADESVDINVNWMIITYKKLSYVLDNSMQCVDPFYNGLAAVYEYVDYDKYLGFINEQGELVIPYQYHCCHGAFPENQRPSLGHLK